MAPTSQIFRPGATPGIRIDPLLAPSASRARPAAANANLNRGRRAISAERCSKSGETNLPGVGRQYRKILGMVDKTQKPVNAKASKDSRK
ncbi:MAG: hypothetical protein WBE80_13355 [Methylocella sp.]